MSEAAAAEKKRHMHLALDDVDFGTPEFIEECKAKKRLKLPENLTNKALYKDIVNIAWPSLIELTLTTLASMVDLMMVGRIHYNAVTAVGLTTQPKFILMTLIQSMCVGTTAMVARYKGAGRPDKANLIHRQSLMMTFFIGLIMAVTGFILAGPMVRFMGANEETFADAQIYMKIQMIGFLPLALTFVNTSALRGAGDSRSAMIYNTIANVVNVFFNWCLIYGNLGFPKMGVAGASLATIIGQTTAFVIGMVVVTRKSEKKYLHLEMRLGFKPDKEALSAIFKIGFPSMIEQLIMRAGMIMFARMVVSLGNLQYATHQVCMNIQSLSFMAGQAIAVSSTSLVGQSLGKRRPDMARAYSFRSATIGMMISAFLMLVFAIFGKYIVMAYNEDPEVISLGGQIMLFVAFLQPFQCTQFVFAGSLRGAGDTRVTAMITLVTVLFVRTGLGYLFMKVLNLGLFGAWYAMACDQILRTVLVTMRYMNGKWMYLKIRND